MQVEIEDVEDLLTTGSNEGSAVIGVEPPRAPVPSPAPSKIYGAGIPVPGPDPGPGPAKGREVGWIFY